MSGEAYQFIHYLAYQIYLNLLYARRKLTQGFPFLETVKLFQLILLLYTNQSLCNVYLREVSNFRYFNEKSFCWYLSRALPEV